MLSSNDLLSNKCNLCLLARRNSLFTFI